MKVIRFVLASVVLFIYAQAILKIWTGHFMSYWKKIILDESKSEKKISS